MKKLIVLGLAVITMAACQQEQRYFAESAETKTLEAGIIAYESGDWDQWRSGFADTAKIYVNSKDAMSVDERLENLKGMAAAFSSYGFDKEDDHIEMVVDKEDETWVYYWAQHNATLTNGKNIGNPVHLAVQFAEGKIVAEHVYFDGTELNAEITAMNQPEEVSEESQDDDSDGDGDGDEN